MTTWRTFRLPLDGVLAGECGGTGPPLILIHGWALDRRMWAPQRRAFRRHFTTVSYDRRGFGQTTCAPDLEREIDDLDAILDALQLLHAAILGMSQGGRVALRYALARPNRVLALVLQGAPFESTPPPAGDLAYLPLREYAAMHAHGQMANLRGALSAHPLMDVPISHVSARAALLRMIEGYRAEDLAATPAASRAAFADVREQLGEVWAPALVLTGEGEMPWLNAAADQLAVSLPRATRARVAGGGHLVNMTAPRAYNRLVIRWLEANLP